MHAEAAYWLLLTDEKTPDAEKVRALLDAWRALGSTSARGLFELAPATLASILSQTEEALAPLLQLREVLPRTQRQLEQLASAQVDLLVRGDRGFPRALRALADAPPALWFAGSRDPLAQQTVAITGSRDADAASVAFARTVGSALASEHRTVIAGVARAVERAALEGALGIDGGMAIAVVAQGIARALPDLSRLRPALRAGRLLVISPFHPEAPWQPWSERVRGDLLLGLAERLVIAQATTTTGGTWELAQRALLAGDRPLAREAMADGNRALLEAGASPIPWPADAAALLAGLLDEPAPSAVEPETQGEEEEEDPVPGGVLAEALVGYLRRGHGRTIGKGVLVQALAVPEWSLDATLETLIAAGWVREQVRRAGAGYTLAPRDAPARAASGFQRSLFAQDDQQ